MTFTFHYVLAQSIAALCIIVFCVYLSSKNAYPVHSSLILTNTGEIQLVSPHSSLDGSDLPPKTYQLQATSRFNFMGCWLIMTPNFPELAPESEFLVEHQLYQKSRVSNFLPKQLFIFRDSITKQDFSRIANVIKQL